MLTNVTARKLADPTSSLPTSHSAANQQINGVDFLNLEYLVGLGNRPGSTGRTCLPAVLLSRLRELPGCQCIDDLRNRNCPTKTPQNTTDTHESEPGAQ